VAQALVREEQLRQFKNELMSDSESLTDKTLALEGYTVFFFICIALPKQFKE